MVLTAARHGTDDAAAGRARGGPVAGRGGPLPVADRRARRAVALTFPIAFALHDLEEVLAAQRWGATAPARVAERFPGAPSWLVDAVGITGKGMGVAVAVVAAGVGVTTALALRRVDDDLGPLPAVLAVYTAHGATHVAQAVALRGYTPGVATVPLVIAPYSVWAWRTLRRSGLRRTPAAQVRQLAVAGVCAVGLAALGHALGRAVEGTARR